MKIKKWLGLNSRKRGIALVLVVGALALMVVLLLAMFSVTQTEFSSTRGHVAAQSAKQLADVATAIVQAQLQNGQNTAKNATSRTIHATQPGAVRVYNKSGFLAGYKLYSSSKMAETTAGLAGEKKFVTDSVPPTDWNSDKNKARYVDLNEPVVRAPLAGTVPAIYFPVIDPRAAFNELGSHTPAAGAATTQVEGFSYTKTIDGVVTPADSASDSSLLRLPMPVEWMYVLEDGTFGTLDADNKFVSATSGVEATLSNPIVGRIAFWGDDESSKINVNTASEPTFMGTPFYFHDRDRKWAHFPPANGEYQRYPGHPATVALSSVLMPNLRLDPVKPDAGLTAVDVRDIKEELYDFAPKIVRGGSKSGTVPFVYDAFDGSRPEDSATPAGTPGTPSSAIDISVSKKERLYATVDEMLFKDGSIQGSPRVASRYPASGSTPSTLPNGQALFDRDILERSRFFLTAHSRAPEFSIHGLPRICIWPVADETQAKDKPAPDKLRTALDNVIALCSTNRRATSETSTSVKNSYFFRRSLALHPTHDVTGAASGQSSSPGLARNSKLLEYIAKQLTQLNYPQSGSTTGSSASFEEKYGLDNVNQMAIQIFDYIRCTNLYDGLLAEFAEGSGGNVYDQRDSIAADCRTFTTQRKNSGSPHPGHGQVIPAKWTQNGKDYRGFGRMFTISEFGFKVVCTADGKLDEYAVEYAGVKSGGASAVRINPNVVGGDLTNDEAYPGKNLGLANASDGKARWYSNFPPLSATATDAPQTTKYGTSIDGDADAQPLHPFFHPGYDPANWNLSLAEDTPLSDGVTKNAATGEIYPAEKRIQVILMMESFCPNKGFTSIYPEYTILLDGDYISQIKVTGTERGVDTEFTPFNTVQDFTIKSNESGNLYGDSPAGGFVNPSQVMSGTWMRGISGESGKFGGIVRTQAESGYKEGGLNNFEFTSNFITVARDKPLQFTFPDRDFVIKIYSTKDKDKLTSEYLVQTININLGAKPPVMPVPYLVGTQESIDAGGIGGYGYLAEWTDPPPYKDGENPNHYRRAVQPPHYWCFNHDGIIGLKQGQINPAYSKTSRTDPSLEDGQKLWTDVPGFNNTGGNLGQSIQGRLSNASGIADASVLSVTVPPRAPAAVGSTDQVSDVYRTMVPKVGDYRIVAARSEVPSSMWARHPSWTDLNITRHTVQTWSGARDNSEGGVWYGGDKSGNDLALNLPKLSYYDTDPVTSLLTDAHRLPDLPPDDKWVTASRSYGDFDVAVSDGREGPYINKPDEGTFSAGNRTVINSDGTSETIKFYRGANFYTPPSGVISSTSNSKDEEGKVASGSHMTPNRMISSPVLFGSLPTGVWPGGAAASTTSAMIQGGLSSSYADSNPWQTLLFRPYVKSSTDGADTHPGGLNPRDHYLLDLFFMPVVEPYAISEPLSEAGKINLNYQILPFTNIRRATGLHALLKGEFMTAIPNTDPVSAKSNTGHAPQGEDATWDSFWKDDTSTYGKKYWHRPIDTVETLRQFDDKFSFSYTEDATKNENGLFRSASQICEVHLVPDVSGGVGDGEGTETSTNMKNMTASTRARNMERFWQAHSPTGDNIRERPYSNIYSRVTTRSNTFRIHVRAQIIKKSRSTDPATFDPDKDTVLSEYRGSTLLERYIDPNDTEHPLPDYASAADPLAEEPLDTFYKFHTLETKRFNP